MSNLEKKDTLLEKLLRRFKVTQILAGTFLIMIITGAILLSLPVSNAQTDISFFNNLFVSVSAVCVTGLSPVTVMEQYTYFGKTVLIVLMETGGLGFMSFAALIFTSLHFHMSFSELRAFAGAAGMPTFEDIRDYILSIFRFTLFFEALGFVLLAVAFIPYYGTSCGLFQALFLSVSAFTNAGFDALSSASLIPFQNNLLVNTAVILLIVTGGLGFMVWIELTTHLKNRISRKKNDKEIPSFWHNLSVHAKLVLSMTFILIISGSILFLLMEWNNPDTIGSLPVSDKVLAALFQSVTLRTAGFMSVSIGSCTKAMRCIMLLFMLIGGSPGGTAGGMKTTTFAVVMIMIVSALRGNLSNISVFHRRLRRRDCIYASLVLCVYLAFVFLAMILLFITDGNTLSSFDLLFEAVSAIATVGLSAGITASLSTGGKVIIMFLMFAGRIGPVALIALMRGREGKKKQLIRYPDSNFIVG